MSDYEWPQRNRPGTFTKNWKIYQPAVGETGWGEDVDFNFKIIDEHLGNKISELKDVSLNDIGIKNILQYKLDSFGQPKWLNVPLTLQNHADIDLDLSSLKNGHILRYNQPDAGQPGIWRASPYLEGWDLGTPPDTNYIWIYVPEDPLHPDPDGPHVWRPLPAPYILADGNNPMTGDLDLNSNQIINLGSPSAPHHATSLQYITSNYSDTWGHPVKGFFNPNNYNLFFPEDAIAGDRFIANNTVFDNGSAVVTKNHIYLYNGETWVDQVPTIGKTVYVISDKKPYTYNDAINNINPLEHPAGGTSWAPIEGGTYTLTKEDVERVLTGEITTHTHRMIPEEGGTGTWGLIVGDITDQSDLQEAFATKVSISLLGVANGVAELNSSGVVPPDQLPSYVDDVLEYPTLSAFPSPGLGGAIYFALDTGKQYRWGGSTYIEITAGGVTLGETSDTAYRGDRGKIAYDHSQSAHLILGQTSTTAYRGDLGKIAYDHSQVPHAPATAQKNSDITKAEIEAKLTGIISTHTHSSGVPSPHATTHISGGSDTIPDATTTNSGLLSSSDKLKLDGIASEANKYVHPTSDGYHHIPATGTTNNQKVLKSGNTAGSEYWGTISFSEITNLPSTLAAYGITDAAPLIHSHNYLSAALKGTAEGVAELDSNGKVPVSQLPSVAGGDLLLSEIIIDVAKDWGGRKITNVGTPTEDGDVATKAYVDAAATLTLGETETTAYWGDRGKIAYDHSQAAHAPPDAQKNVQSDWLATTGDAQILNKPYIPNFSVGWDIGDLDD